MLQAIIDKHLNINVIECNPRFGEHQQSLLNLTDSFYWLYLESRGEDIEKHEFIKMNRAIKQIRSHKDIYL